MKQRALPSRMSGLSLVELMIAMSLGLATVAAVGWVYLGTIQTYRTHDAMSRLQEGARHSFEVIGRDLRMTGTTGCSYSSSVNVLNNATGNWFENLLLQPIYSDEQDGDESTQTEYSDALRVLRADVSREYLVSAHNAGTSTFTTKTAHGLGAGQLMVATDCSHVSVFQAVSANGSQLTHTKAGTPGNASAQLGSPLNTNYTYATGSRLYKMNAVTYYVDENAAGTPSLFRMSPQGSSATLTPEELVEGVEDLRVTYGVDSSSPADGLVDVVGGEAYLTADDVSNSAALGANAQQRWSRVVSIRISLLMRTVEDRMVPVAQHYAYNGDDDITAPDLRMRKVFTHVIKLRNR